MPPLVSSFAEERYINESTTEDMSSDIVEELDADYVEKQTGTLKRVASNDNIAECSRSGKKSKHDYSDNIIVVVGKFKRRVSFSVPREILCASSDYFEAACSGSWIEAKDKTVHLEAESTALFQVYLHWAYHCEIDWELLGDAVSKQDRMHVDDALDFMFIDLYALADYLQDSALAQQVIEDWFTYLWSEPQLPNTQTLVRAYAKTAAGSPLRIMLVEVYTAHVNHESFKRVAAKYPAEFVSDVAIALLEHVRDRSWEDTQAKIRALAPA